DPVIGAQVVIDLRRESNGFENVLRGAHIVEGRPVATIRQREEIHKVFCNAALPYQRDLVTRKWISAHNAIRRSIAVENVIEDADARIGEVPLPHRRRRYALQRAWRPGRPRAIGAERRPKERSVTAVVDLWNKDRPAHRYTKFIRTALFPRCRRPGP